ncbi:unnamed protein product, partial [Lymnaea stagnalis]
MKIAVEGCCHGELDKIYESVAELEKQNGFKIDLLLICGDFQAVRHFDDFQALAVPPKYQQLNTFYKYYSGEKTAPVLTVFIGGNHEASNYMQELPYGGWVAPNIYYMGYAGLIQVGGLRIGGISGIFKGHDYNRGHHERPPYDDNTKRSVYHIRNLEVFRLKQITGPVDVFLSHDWPKGIYHHGDTAALIKKKPFFQKEIEENKLGSRPLSDLLTHLQPSYWFAAHLHVKFAAHVEHSPPTGTQPAKKTKFLALDKCLPRRHFLQVFDLPHNTGEGLKIKLDAEWLAVLQSTNHLLNLSPSNMYMPGPGCKERYDFQVSEKDKEKIKEIFGNDLTLPENFIHTSPPLHGNPLSRARSKPQPLSVQVNPQTTLLCSMLDITDPNAKLLGKTSQELLEESDIGLPDEDKKIEDESSDDAIDDDSSDEMPSAIDSSIDASTMSLSMNASSACDSFHTACDSPNASSVGALSMLNAVTSTPYKHLASKLTPAEDISVQDDDDELLSILSAQKSKTSEKSLELSSVLGDKTGAVPGEISLSGTEAPNGVHAGNDELPLLLAHNTFSDISIGCGDNLHITSVSHADQTSTQPSSPQDRVPFPLKSERSSLGMSDLCLSSNTPVDLCVNDQVINCWPPKPGKKRDSSDDGLHEDCVTPILKVSQEVL